MAPDPQPTATKSKTTEEQLGSQAASWVRPRMGKPAEPVPEPEPEPEEEEEEEYADLPLWKRALMKKRAEEVRKKEQANMRKVCGGRRGVVGGGVIYKYREEG